MDKKNVILTGMPGAGKSTLGVVLAKTLNMPFMDTDLTIQQNEGRTLQEIINSDGIGRFLEIEEKTVTGIQVQGHVIATGGSVVYSHAAISHLKTGGIVVYLKLGYHPIIKRIKNIETRGIVLKPGQSLHDLYRERVSLYEKYADIIINCSGKRFVETLNEIRQRVEKLF